MAPSMAKFTDGEKLLCYHGSVFYEAKCVRSKKHGNSHLYYVHYQGWNKNWDEWVDESRICKTNSEDLNEKEKLPASCLSAEKDNRKKDKTRQSLSGGSAPGTPVSAERGGRSIRTPLTPGKLKVSRTRNAAISGGGDAGKQKQDNEQLSTTSREEVSSTTSTTFTASTPASNRDLNNQQSQSSKVNIPVSNEVDSESEVGASSAMEGVEDSFFGGTQSAKFEISIPEELRYELVSDWDLLSNKKSLFYLPAKITVANILSEYTKNAEKLALDGKNGMTELRLGMIVELAQGIKGLFDAFVGTQLLYKSEQVQFEDVMLKDTSGKEPSDIYGSAHLLRLMVRIGGLLDRYNIREESNVRLLESLISDFLHYLEENKSRLFTSKNYVQASEEYLGKTASGSFEPFS